MFGKPIAAISTPYGRGAISVIRLTGQGCIEIASKVFFPKNKKLLCECPCNTAVYGDIYSDGNIIDDGVAVCFNAPKSYTGEDSVEISCHGGILVTQLVLRALLEAGADVAGAGEFTKRAYANGKLRLSQAEAIMDIIDAKTPSALRIANNGGRGTLSKKAEEIYNGIKFLLASIYAYIDYPDEDLTDVTVDEMKHRLLEIHTLLDSLEKSYKTGKALKDGINVAICGRPNAGKSSVLNMFTGEETAIVTDIEGTTRDVITSRVVCGDIVLNLADTAGIRETDDTVESIGVKRALDEISKAELVLAVFDASSNLTQQDREIIKTLKNVPCAKIALLNKDDKHSMMCDDVREISDNFEYTVNISALTQSGKEELQEMISGLFTEGQIDYSAAYITNERQYAEVVCCKRAVSSALGALENGMTQDIAAFDLEDALSAISRLDGRQITDDVVDEIFGKFCVGK